MYAVPFPPNNLNNYQYKSRNIKKSVNYDSKPAGRKNPELKRQPVWLWRHAMSKAKLGKKCITSSEGASTLKFILYKILWCCVSFSLCSFLYPYFLPGILSDFVVSKYNVRVSAVSEMVNQGDDYVAYCIIPNKGALNITQNLQVWWLHNGKPLTSLCEMLRPELATKYSCKLVLSSQAQNIILELTISGM